MSSYRAAGIAQSSFAILGISAFVFIAVVGKATIPAATTTEVCLSAILTILLCRRLGG